MPFSSGLLDAEGRATDSFELPPDTQPALVGLTIRHAFVVMDAGGEIAFESNSVPLTVVD